MTKQTMAWLAAAAMALPGTAMAQGADEVVAKFGAVEVRSSDLRRILQTQDPISRDQLLKTPQALDRLIRTEAFRLALLGEARAKGWDKQPEVTEQLERARDQVVVTSYVNSLARPPASYPSDAELRAAYETAKGELQRPRQWRVAQIFVAAATAGGDKKAADLAAKAKAAGAQFATLARQGSEHAESAAQGGEMGWLAEGQVLPEIGSALASMKAGEVAGPVRSTAGWHVLRMAEERPAAQRSFEEVRDYLSNLLRARRAQENEAKVIDEMLAKNPIAVNEVALIRMRDELAKVR